MSDLFNPSVLSSLVGAIVDQKVVSLSLSITGSSGYLKTLSESVEQSVQTVQGYASDASGAASDASGAATSALTVFNSFTSTYVGIRTIDPILSSQGNELNVSAFYIREADGRLRYLSGRDGSGNPIWRDATVTADLSSLGTAGNGIFLTLSTITPQTVSGQVTFQSSTIVPRVTNWSSQQAATAIDVDGRIVSVQNSINAETARAIAAETSIGGGRVLKTGDTMTGDLKVISTGDAVSVSFRNTTNTTGRNYRINSANDGKLRFVDDTSNTERMVIFPNGTVSVYSSFGASGNITGGSLSANRTDGSDPLVSFQNNNVTRWAAGRSPANSRFFISRFNTSGVFIDSPITINDSDGAITLNKISVNGTISGKSSLLIESAGASVVLNNSSGNNDTNVIFRNLNNARWVMGRSAQNSIFYINRYNDSGAFLDTPFRITENSGIIQCNPIQVTGAISATGEIAGDTLRANSSGTGRSVRIGNDAWIGDNNIPNGMAIRGQNDFDSGWLRFGNSSASLGCSANDSVLKYGGNTVYTSGNLTPDTLGFSNGVTGGVSYTTRPAGSGRTLIRMSGFLTFNNQFAPQTINFPFTIVQMMDYGCSTVIYSGGANYDQLGQIVGVPSGTQMTIVMQETTGTANYPCSVRWFAEGLL